MPARRPPPPEAPAPLYADTEALCAWLLGLLDADPRGLPRSLCRLCLSLLSDVVLALRGVARPTRVQRADETLITLRAQLRLAQRLGLVTEAQLVHGLSLCDLIGRQLGGWRRTLAPPA